MSQIGRLTRRSRASTSSVGHSIIDGLYGLCVSISIRQNAALCASLPGVIGPESVDAQTRAARSAAWTAASANIKKPPALELPIRPARLPIARRPMDNAQGSGLHPLLSRPAVDASQWLHY